MVNVASMAIIIYAYISAVMFVAGTAYVLVKWIFNRKGPTDTYLGLPFLFTYPGQETRWQAFVNILKRIFLFSSAKYDRPLRYTSLAFHWSLWIVLVAHLDIVLSPYITGAGVSEATLEIAGAYIGTAFAVIMTAFGAFLLSRRFYDKYMKRLSSLPDYFSIVLILAIGVARGRRAGGLLPPPRRPARPPPVAGGPAAPSASPPARRAASSATKAPMRWSMARLATRPFSSSMKGCSITAESPGRTSALASSSEDAPMSIQRLFISETFLRSSASMTWMAFLPMTPEFLKEEFFGNTWIYTPRRTVATWPCTWQSFFIP